ncbi:hypothetical protein HZA96_02665 [Candidatus Woesearchaeota archaeon]|nr:hypothetical protein [Candidatus Woesearchaeota archaeon]
MSLFGKLAFWKKKDDDARLGIDTKGDFAALNLNDPQLGNDLGLNNDPNLSNNTNLGLDLDNQQQSFKQFGSQNYSPKNPGTGAAVVRQVEQSPFQQQQVSQHQMLYNKDVELLYAKIDAIRANIESINQRLSNIERILQGQQTQSQIDRRRVY